MNNINLVVLHGYLTRNPELRYTPRGTPVATTGIALNNAFKNQAGELKEETTFVDLETYGPHGQRQAELFKKGMPILIEGRLRQDSWTDKATGQKRSRLKVIVLAWHFTSPKSANPDAPTDAPTAPEPE